MLSLLFQILTFITVIMQSRYPAYGLNCYECISGPTGGTCDVASNSSITSCDPGAIACIQYRVEYDYVFGAYFIRSCLHEGDKPCLDKDFDSEEGLSNFVHPFNYQSVLSCLRDSRSKSGLKPPVSPDQDFPNQEAFLKYKVYYKNLTNSISRKNFGNSGNPLKGAPNIRERQCYSCENEVSEDGFNYEEEDHINSNVDRSFVPACETNVTPTVITCRYARGCAAMWEVRKSAGGTKKTSKIWRGCWNDGEQKCLRGSGTSRYLDSRDKESCSREYDQALPGVYLAWSGLKTIQTSSDYNNYISCRNAAMEKAGADSDLKLTKETDSSNFAKIRYFYCGPRGKCNEWDWRQTTSRPVVITSSSTTEQSSTSLTKSPTIKSTSQVPTVTNASGDIHGGCLIITAPQEENSASQAKQMLNKYLLLVYLLKFI